MQYGEDIESHPLLGLNNDSHVESDDKEQSLILKNKKYRPRKKSYVRKKGKEGPYPKHVFFILGNEFCERYAYYGMRTILILYLKYFLEFSDDTATLIYHSFAVLCYLWPLVGAFIADSWWGKYNTILWLSIWYALGMYTVTLGAIPQVGDLQTHKVLSLTGLFVVAMGTGGIKPCVSAFGGDQFTANQEEYRRSFFSLFYFAINAGSLVSTFVTPIIRDTPCLGEDNCYALAFGIPACLMVVAIIAFVIGTPFYTRIPPQGNIFAELCLAIWSAWKHKWNHPRGAEGKDHWMDYALADTSEKMVQDIKYVLSVLLLYVPLPVFWALFDQQGSRWTLQATTMDGYVGNIRIRPDQMQVLNPLLIVTLIPLFEATLYPCLRHYNWNFTPLQRMTVGQILAGVAFLCAAVVQFAIEEHWTEVPDSQSEVALRVINSAQCDMVITTTQPVYDAWDDENVEGSTSYTGVLVEVGNATNTIEEWINSTYANTDVEIKYECLSDPTINGAIEVNMEGESVINVVVSNNGTVNTLKSNWYEGEILKSISGGGIITVYNALNYDTRVEISRGDNVYEDYNVTSNTAGEPQDMDKNFYNVTVFDDANEEIFREEYWLDTGAMYSLIIRDSANFGDSHENGVIVGDFYEDIKPNHVNIMWLIPQYFVITCGEVFLSVTGLEFSYTQAPPSMKAVLTSFWLLTVSFGNIIVLIIEALTWPDSQAYEYIFYAGLIFVAAFVFVLLALRYEYVDESVFAEVEDDEDEKKIPIEAATGSEVKIIGKANDAYDYDTEL